MNKAGDFEIGGVLADYVDDLKKLNLDPQKIARHVCCFDINKSWELCYVPSYIDTLEFRSGRPAEKKSPQFDAKRKLLAECAERIIAYDLGRELEQWSGYGQFNKSTLAHNAQIAKNALRDILDKIRCISAKRRAAAKRRHEIPEGPVRAELGRLLEGLKPADGWHDEDMAVKVILPHIQNYIRVHPGMQLGEYLDRVLKKWIKTHPEVVPIFTRNSVAK